MKSIIEIIVNNNKELFGINPEVHKINIGFTNTIFAVSNKYIVKICTNIDNEDKFMNEINFYKANKYSNLIPKLYYYSVDKNVVPYYYEVIEKINGVSLYNVWHTLSEEQREKVIKQLCIAMKQIHSNVVNGYDWPKMVIDSFNKLYNNAKKLFSKDELNIIDEAYSNFSNYLESKEFALVHNDLHFDNIFYCDGKIRLIDFERSTYAPIDFDLAIFYRMIRKPWKFASEETEKYTKLEDYKNIMKYIEKYYPKLVNTNNLYKRLAIYDMVYYLKQYINYPNLDELKEDIIAAARIVIL